MKQLEKPKISSQIYAPSKIKSNNVTFKIATKYCSFYYNSTKTQRGAKA
jgi:hypothetical protein